MTVRSGPLRWAVGVGLVALVALAACGGPAGGGDVATAGGEGNPTVEEGDQQPIDEEAQALAFAECMRANGVDMADPAPGQAGLSEAVHGLEDDYDQPIIQQALTACQDFLPQRAHEGGHDAAREESMLALAECLREQGLEVPDNLFEGGGLHDVDDEKLRAAMEECRDVLGGGDGHA